MTFLKNYCILKIECLQSGCRMDKIFLFFLSFIIVYLFYFLFIIISKKGRKKLKEGIEARFLQKVCQVKIEEIKDTSFAQLIALTNSFIVSFTFFVTSFIDNFIFQILIAFTLFVLLIIFIYQGVGKCLKKK